MDHISYWDPNQGNLAEVSQYLAGGVGDHALAAVPLARRGPLDVAFRGHGLLRCCQDLIQLIWRKRRRRRRRRKRRGGEQYTMTPTGEVHPSCDP